MNKKTTLIRQVATSLLAVLWSAAAWGWDSTPDDDGKYDRLFDRPTYFPDWSQPSDWPNAMYYRCDVRLGTADGPMVQNYEVAVYDQDGRLRHCGRSIARDGDLCVLTIRGEEGDTFTFQVIYGDDFEHPIIADIPDTEASFKTNDEVGLDEPFHLVIPGRTYLMETSTEAPVSEEHADVTVIRTINGGEWGTICLPFAMNAGQVTDVFGSDVQLGDFTGCETTFEDEAQTEVKRINVLFRSVNAIEANHPYIIKVSRDVTQFDVDDVDITVDAQTPPVIDCDELRFGSGTPRDPYRYIYNSFIGNYTDGFLIPDQCLFLSGGKFWYSKGKTNLMAFRAYFSFYDVLSEALDAGANMSILFDGIATGIAPLHSTLEPDGTYYDLQGRRVEHPTKGIYLVNGRKIIIRAY